MSALLDSEAPARPGHDRSARRRSRRIWLVLVATLVLGIGISVWSNAGDETWPGRLDPRNPGGDGGQAVAKVLDDQGLDVTIVRSAAAFEDTDVDRATVVVSNTGDLAPSTLRRLVRHSAGAPTVLLDPPFPVVEELDKSLTAVPDGSVRRVAGSNCTAPVDLAGLRLAADTGLLYSDRSSSTDDGCFDGLGGALLLPRDDGVALFGGGDALTNDQVLRADNAAVALRLLGQEPRVVWYVADAADATADEAVSLVSLLPDAVIPSLWLVALSALALLLWRVRRLGPLSVEPLPVVVRAVETAHSRGRLYRRGGDRGHAATTLQEAARADLVVRLRMDRGADAPTTAHAAAAHLGRDVGEIAALLDPHRPAPANDAELVALARALARLRREVRRA